MTREQRVYVFLLVVLQRVLQVLDVGALRASLWANQFAQWCVQKQMACNARVRRVRRLEP